MDAWDAVMDTPPARLSCFAQKALQCIYQHRLLSTGQLRRLLLPYATSTYAQRELRKLRSCELIDRVPQQRTSEGLWFTTSLGAQVVESGRELPPRRYRMNAHRAVGPLQQHTLAVNDVGLAFAETARRLGHECGPLDWIPEVAHRFRDGGSFETSHVICDALLNYIIADTAARRRDQLQFFIELDRGTMSVARLAAKLQLYARYYDYLPAGKRGMPSTKCLWEYDYPRFPRVLVILDGRIESRLEHRLNDLEVRLARMSFLERRREGLKVGVTTLAKLVDPGAHQPIFARLLPHTNQHGSSMDLYLLLRARPHPEVLHIHASSTVPHGTKFVTPGNIMLLALLQTLNNLMEICSLLLPMPMWWSG